jgi:hypothetical protein
MSQIAVVTVNVVADTPRSGQGEIDANPMPEPSANKTNETPAATKAPAMIAGQEAVDKALAAIDPAPTPAVRASNVCSMMDLRTSGANTLRAGE